MSNLDNQSIEAIKSVIRKIEHANNNVCIDMSKEEVYSIRNTLDGTIGELTSLVVDVPEFVVVDWGSLVFPKVHSVYTDVTMSSEKYKREFEIKNNSKLHLYRKV